MISKHLPPTTLTATQPRASAGGHGSYDGPVTADMISMGSALGCPYLASMKRPEFSSEAGESGPNVNLTRAGASSAALASVAGGLGMGAAAACCPHTSKKPEQPEG